MAVAEKTVQAPAKAEAVKQKHRIAPRYGVWNEKDSIILQVALPGTKKEAIKMKALKDFITIRAQRGEIEYALDLEFGVRIEPEKTKSTYEEGLLRIELQRYKPLDHAFNVPIE
jgi:HSP20 family protein